MAQYQDRSIDEYTYKPVELNTDKWRQFNPFRGFYLYHPPNWDIRDSGEFGSPALQPHLQLKRTYFFSPGIKTGTHDNYSSNAGLVKGARIGLLMTARNQDQNDTMTKADCPYKNKNYIEQEVMVFDSYTVCRNRVFGPHFDSGYRYNTFTNKMSYELSITYNGAELPATKDYYRSVVETMLASFALY